MYSKLIISLWLCALSAYGQATLNNVKLSNGQIGFIPPAGYIISEDFEGACPNTGWSFSSSQTTCENTNVIVGSFSLVCTNGQYAISPTACGNNLFYALKFGQVPSSSDVILELRDAGDTDDIVELRDRPDGDIYFYSHNQAQGPLLLHHPTRGTVYYYWVEYTPGSGANGVINIYVSTTTTKPGSATQTMSNSGSTAAADHFRLLAAPGTYMIYDYVRTKATPIGSNP